MPNTLDFFFPAPPTGLGRKETVLSDLTPSIVDTFLTSEFIGVKYFVVVNDRTNGEVYMSEFTVAHDGAIATFTEANIVDSVGMVRPVIEAAVSGGSVEITVTPGAGTDTQVIMKTIEMNVS